MGESAAILQHTFPIGQLSRQPATPALNSVDTRPAHLYTGVGRSSLVSQPIYRKGGASLCPLLAS